ncbi:pilus assembly protein TadG-related protein [Ruegeria sp. SCP11]|uniref:pilus assembly protein TadG-related protein n=1 Tax=Ruegeria sp. SCP11 TaxID=3141378 RepID=UPI003339AEFA
MRRDVCGGVVIFVALALPFFLALTALVIDIGLARLVASRLQIAADASALAGTALLPDEGDAVTEAVLYAQKNHPDGGAYQILVASDVEIGNWNFGTFTPNGTPRNAVRTTTRKDGSNSSPLAAFFARVAGITEFNFSRSAVAHRGVGEGCPGGGLFTDANVESGSNNTYVNGFCLYGADGVKISSDNAFDEGSTIAMNDTVDFEQGGANSGVSDALTEADYTLALPLLVPAIINGMESSIADLPPFITNGSVELSEITDTTPLTPNTLYVVDEVADLGSNRTISDIAIVAGKEVKVGSNVNLSNVVFASPDKVLLGSNNNVGAPGFCSSGFFNVYLFSLSDIEFGSNNNLRGIQIGGQGKLKLGSDVAGIEGVFAEVTDLIDYGSADTWTSCSGGLDSYFELPIIPNGLGPLALVQ